MEAQAKDGDVSKLIELLKNTGPIEILINNAGFAVPQIFCDRFYCYLLENEAYGILLVLDYSHSMFLNPPKSFSICS